MMIRPIAKRALSPGVRGPLSSWLIAILITLLFSGSTCVVVYCSEDCDPCLVQTCKCSVCNHTSNFEASHRLDVYDSSWIADSQDHVTRVYGNILGLSLDRALGARAHSEDELARFARDVLAVNADLFGPRPADGRWVLDGVQRFDSSRVVSFHEAGADESSLDAGDAGGARATFLFDGRGNLVEIDHAQR